MPVNYIICAAGEGSRFNADFPGVAKPAIKLKQRYLIDWSLSSLPIFTEDKIIIITQKKHKLKSRFLPEIIKAYPFTECSWLELEELTGGQLETAALTKDLINKEGSIAIFNCDTYFQSKTLTSLMNDPSIEGIIPCAQVPGESWSFCKINDNNKVLEVAEKKRISDWASVGFYYFRDPNLFFKTSQSYIEGCSENESYVAPLYEEYINKNYKVVMDEVSLFKPMGSPEQIEKYWDTEISNVVNENFSKTLVVDIDDTLTINNSSPHYAEKKPNTKVIKKLQEYKRAGYEIILYSARRMKTCKNNEAHVIKDIAQITINWLDKHEIPYDGLKFGKPFAENAFYVDDKAVRPREFIELSVDEINKLIERDKAKLNLATR